METTEENKSILKRVMCNRWGNLIVRDVYGNNINELCGQITYKKYLEIEKRSMPGVTVFDGLEHYRCVACELKSKEEKENETTC
jgi:hypothetical protein